MINIKQTIQSVNNAIESGNRDTNSIKNYPKNLIFKVKIFDPDTKEYYTVTYY